MKDDDKESLKTGANMLMQTERACVATSMVLVINDNPCGLMFALRYSCRSCP